MRPNRTEVATFALAIALIALAVFCRPADAYILGVGDGSTDATPARELGAKVYRVVIDPDVPLAEYDARVFAYRAQGMEPQFVVGGTGTHGHESARGVVPTAVAVAKRWPYAYSISVINEPDLSGMSVCEYDRTFIQAYRSLRPLGIRRVLFGEWSPAHGLEWQIATLDPKRCGTAARTLRRIVTRVAWHGYWSSIDLGRQFAQFTKAATGHTPMLYITEAGAILRGHTVKDASASDSDLGGLRYWRHALHVVKRDHVKEIVAWDVHSPQTGAWDSGLIDSDGRFRPAFNLIATTPHV